MIATKNLSFLITLLVITGCVTSNFNQGKNSFIEGKNKEAIEFFSKSLTDENNENKYPKHVIYNNRGLAYFNDRQRDNALADYNKALSLDETNAATYYNRGVLYQFEQKYEKALSDFNKAIELDPTDASTAFLRRGIIFYDQGKLDQSLSDINKAIELEPNFTYAYWNRGNYYYFQRDYISAIANYDTALLQSPYYTDAYLSRGISYYRLERYKDALKDFNISFKLNPEYALGNALWIFKTENFLGKNEKNALNIILDASKNITSHKESYSELAVLFGNFYLGNISEDDLILKTTDNDKEIEKFKKSQVYYHIAQKYLFEGNKNKAIEMFQMAFKFYMPENMIDPSNRSLDEILRNL